MNERDLSRLNDMVTLVGGVLTVAIMVRMLKPDLMKTLQMRTCLLVAHGAKRVADTATTMAMNADTAYHRLSNVTV